jgi:hypothetical protein
MARIGTALLLTALCIVACREVAAQSAEPAGADQDAGSLSATPPARPDAEPPAGNRHAGPALRFKRIWGVDIEGVKVVSSGYMLAFRYRVLDAEKAKPLNEKKTRPYLIDEATGIRLSVPAMEKVGELRQSAAPTAGKSYFMIFGNPGKVVKSGSRVSVVIGNFHIDGLVAE